MTSEDDAAISIKLKSESGYECEVEEKITLIQWSRICTILYEDKDNDNGN